MVDRTMISFYTSPMRPTAVILLLVLALTVLAPTASFAFAAIREECPVLSDLDVCHPAASALAGDGEMPCLSPAICTAVPLLIRSTSEPLQPVFTELILTAGREHPPRS